MPGILEFSTVAALITPEPPKTLIGESCAEYECEVGMVRSRGRFESQQYLSGINAELVASCSNSGRVTWSTPHGGCPRLFYHLASSSFPGLMITGSITYNR